MLKRNQGCFILPYESTMCSFILSDIYFIIIIIPSAEMKKT